MPTEADTRIILDRLLREAGWDIENKAVVSTEEPAADGRADYLLKNLRSQPLAKSSFPACPKSLVASPPLR
jgi:hypothetical protein